MRRGIESLVSLWSLHTPSADVPQLEPGFTYTNEVECLSRDEFVAVMAETSPPLTELWIRGIVVNGDVACVFFEGKDPVTELRVRHAWYVDVDAAGAKVRSIVDVRSNVLPLK